MSDELLVGGQCALAEAKLLYRIIGPENTVEKLRDLIVVPPKIEKVLRAYMRERPEDAWWIEQSLEFRRDILKEFNRLVRDGSSNCLQEHGPDLPEVEEQPSIDQGLKVCHLIAQVQKPRSLSNDSLDNSVDARIRVPVNT